MPKVSREIKKPITVRIPQDAARYLKARTFSTNETTTDFIEKAIRADMRKNPDIAALARGETGGKEGEK